MRFGSRTTTATAVLMLTLGLVSALKPADLDIPVSRVDIAVSMADIPMFNPEMLQRIEVKQAKKPVLQAVWQQLTVMAQNMTDGGMAHQLEEVVLREKPRRALADACADLTTQCTDWLNAGQCGLSWTAGGSSIAKYWCPKTCGVCGCTDLTTQCATWKTQGYCTPTYTATVSGVPMSILYDVCPTTCGTCCLDKTTACTTSWSTTYCTGYTSNKLDIGTYWCPKTCRTCIKSTPTAVAKSPPPPPPKSPPPPPPTSGCGDRTTECASWKTSGYCAEIFTLQGLSVKDYWCPKTCGTCCVDIQSTDTCFGWLNKGYCAGGWTSPDSTGFKKDVRDWCPSTCGLCCSNKYEECPRWKDGGYCSAGYTYKNQSVITYWCPLTCQTCKQRNAPPSPPPISPSPPPSSPSPPLNSACMDLKDVAQCNTWRAAGYCKPGYETTTDHKSISQYWCPKSCSTCMDRNQCNNGQRVLMQSVAPLKGDQRVPDADIKVALAGEPMTVHVHAPMPEDGVGTNTTRGGNPGRRLLDNSLPLTWYGGPIMSGTVRVHLIWFGSWPSNTPTKPLIEDFVANLGCTKWWNIMKGNCITDKTSGKQSCIGGLVLGRSIFVKGTSLYDGNAADTHSSKTVSAVVQNAMNAGQLGTVNPATDLTIIMASADVVMNPAFRTKWCGWHSSWYSSSAYYKYGLIGNPLAQSEKPSSCGNIQPPPNGDPQADNMASILAHEIAEAVTNPQGNAWHDTINDENADKCAWQFGDIQFLGPNRLPWNVQVGSKYWQIQMNWNVDTNSCQAHAGW